MKLSAHMGSHSTKQAALLKAGTRRRTAALLLLLAPAGLLADAYSDYVLGLSPTTYFRLDETNTSPGQIPLNLGTLGAGYGFYTTLGGGVTTTTGVNGGAIAGNAGVTTTGFAVNLLDGKYAVHPTVYAAGNASFTLSLWVKPTSFAVNDFATPFSCGEGALHSIMISENGYAGDGSLLIGLYGLNIFSSAGKLTAGVWNHIGLTWNGTTMQLYINGTPDNYWIGTLDSYTTYGFLGGLYSGASPYNGGLDEFAYWNGTALTGAQMQPLAGVPVNYSYQTAPSASYPDTTGNKLRDGARSITGYYTDPHWVGFNLVDIGGPAVVTFDLHQVTHVNSLTLSFLAAVGLGVYPPESFSVSFGTNGTDFGPAQTYATTAFERGGEIWAPSSATRAVNGQGRYVRLSMTHTGGVSAQFLFADEVLFTTSGSDGLESAPLTPVSYVHEAGHEPFGAYPDTGGVKLTDGLMAAIGHYSDPAWVGWKLDTGGAPQVVFDFGKEKRFTQVGLRFYNWPYVGGAAPESFTVSYSDDGVTFAGTESFTTTATERDPSGVGEATVSRAIRDLSGTGRYVRFTATEAYPGAPVMLLDEMQFQGVALPPRGTLICVF